MRGGFRVKGRKIKNKGGRVFFYFRRICFKFFRRRLKSWVVFSFIDILWFFLYVYICDIV